MHTFQIGDGIIFHDSVSGEAIDGKVLDISEVAGMFLELEKPVMTTLGIELNRVWFNQGKTIYSPLGHKRFITHKNKYN